jgi:hypothetical protein
MNRYNIFNNKKSSSSQSFYLREESFPKLDASYNILEKEENIGEMKKNISYVDKLNYMIEEKIKDDLKPGWIRLTLNRKKNVNIIKNDNKLNDFDISSDEIKKRLQPMIDRWENYKLNYIELYGEDEYYYHHKFPNYNYSCYLNIIEEDDELSESFDIDTSLQESNSDFDNFY